MPRNATENKTLAGLVCCASDDWFIASYSMREAGSTTLTESELSKTLRAHG